MLNGAQAEEKEIHIKEVASGRSISRLRICGSDMIEDMCNRLSCNFGARGRAAESQRSGNDDIFPREGRILDPYENPVSYNKQRWRPETTGQSQRMLRRVMWQPSAQVQRYGPRE